MRTCLALTALLVLGCGAERSVVVSPRLGLSTSSLSFGTIAVGAVAEQPLTLRSESKTTLHFSALTLVGEAATSFELVLPSSMELEADQTLTLTLRYRPKTEGGHWARLLILSDAENGAEQLVSLVGTATEEDLCAGVTCTQPPGPCHQPTGTCERGLCTYAPSTGTACDDGNGCTTNDVCEAGRCIGAPLVCVTPAAPTCSGPNTLTLFVAPGVCAAGSCTYARAEQTCAGGCVGGVCRGDPCSGVVCNRPPDQCAQPIGTCQAGSCTYAPRTDGSACDDGSACTAGDACRAGVCEGQPLACTSPPASTCAGPTTLTTWTSPGVCTAGACQYLRTDRACAGGCANGVCNGDPCAGVVCNQPPGQCFQATGTCVGGSCTYQPRPGGSTCNDGNACTVGDACQGGTCQGTAMSCTTPPAASCFGPNTRTTWTTPGTCSTGTCNYVRVDQSCPFGCAAGACRADPCLGVTCNQPPGPCYQSAGTCQNGSCSYSPRAAGAACDDANACTSQDACSGSGTCAGTATVCQQPPAATCLDATTRRTWDPTGTCGAGGACTYVSHDNVCPTGCDAMTRACRTSCPTGEHLCGSSCVSNTATATCGASCSPCPSTPNGAASCNGTSCGIQCATGYGTCATGCCRLPGSRATGPMVTPRAYHTATLLPSGKVLIIGGLTGSTGTLNVEAFDPVTETFTAAGTIREAAFSHTSTLLPNGTVLIVGGSATPQLYNPATMTTALTLNPMSRPRRHHTATLLPNGKVLIAGDSTIAGGATAELYDPTTGSFTPTGPLNCYRSDATATLLDDGRVLIAGGHWTPSAGTTMPCVPVDVYNPTSGLFTMGPSMLTPRTGHVATKLPNGRVLLAGGSDASAPVTATEIFNPTGNSIQPAGILPGPGPAGQLLAVRLLDNVWFWEVPDAVFSFVTAGNTFTTATQTNELYPYWATATTLPSGMVLVAGGQQSYPLPMGRLFW